MSETDPGFEAGRKLGLVIVPGDPVTGEFDDSVPLLVVGMREPPPILKLKRIQLLGSVQLINPTSLVPVPPDKTFVDFAGHGVNPPPDAIYLLGKE